MPTAPTIKLCRCKECGVEFMTTHKRRFCTVKCRKASRNTGPFSDSRVCVGCGVPFTAKVGQQVYCRSSCADKTYRESYEKPKDLWGSCRYCKKRHPKIHENKGKKYCSDTCRSKAEAAMRQQAEIKKQIAKVNAAASRMCRCAKCCQECGAVFIAKQTASVKCKTCSTYKRIHESGEIVRARCNQCHCVFEFIRKPTGDYPRKCTSCHKDNNREYRRQTKHKRRQLKKCGPIERFSALSVYERDGWCCYICGCVVQRYKSQAFVGVMPDEATLDHVWPLSKGGTHTMDNVRTACRMCNSLKSDATPDPILVTP